MAVVAYTAPALGDATAPWWLPGGNLQTLWPAIMGRHWEATVHYQRERWDTPDGDFVDVDWLLDAPSTPASGAPPQRPLLVLFHGLEGSAQSHYAKAFARVAAARQWDFAVPHFRGCSGPLNRAPRAYHSGDYQEVGWMLERFQSKRMHGTKGTPAPMLAVGVSLGGNALLRWAQEAGQSAEQTVKALVAISAPLDLHASATAIDVGLNKQIYTRMFLSTMKPRALARHQNFPKLFDLDAVMRATTLREFDDAFTAPVHGFKNAVDYWQRCSSKPHLHKIKVPSLVINAQNDPFVPAASLPSLHQHHQHLRLWQPSRGGHVGFPAPGTGRFSALPQQVCDWLVTPL
jgi:predicted alpha/beta-fold hydrolase